MMEPAHYGKIVLTPQPAGHEPQFRGQETTP
jgi:hypothetical protein